MSEYPSFKAHVKNTLISCAPLYQSYFVNYEYLICSEAFKNSFYYIIDAHEDNYLHLTGVSTFLSAEDFFHKCLNGTLLESHFDFNRLGQSPKEAKGSVRRKITSLSSITNIFTSTSLVEEDFQKNNIQCSFATSQGTSTLGFTSLGRARPMTLLKGNLLNPMKSKNISLVLRKKSGETKYTDIIFGTPETLSYYYEYISELLSDDIQKQITNSKQL